VPEETKNWQIKHGFEIGVKVTCPREASENKYAATGVIASNIFNENFNKILKKFNKKWGIYNDPADRVFIKVEKLEDKPINKPEYMMVQINLCTVIPLTA